MADTFIPPAQRAEQARSDFSRQYRDRLAVTLKKSWNRETMSALGYPSNPTNRQFERWADELIDSGQFTATREDGTPAPPITIQMMQSSLSDEQKADMARQYGTSNLREIILTRPQLNTAAQQVGQATYNHSGSIPFLGGASIIDAIMGFVDWIRDGCPRGRDGGILSGITETVARRATAGVGNDVSNLLAQNAPGINPGMRNYIAGQVRAAGEQSAGLAPVTPTESLATVSVGQDVSPSGQAANNPPITVTGGTPQERLTNTLNQVSTNMIAGIPAGSTLRANLQVLQPRLVQSGVTVMTNPENQGLLRSGTPEAMTTLAGNYADELLRDGNTRRQVAVLLGANPDATAEQLKPQLAGMLGGAISPSARNGILQALGPADGPIVASNTPPQPIASPPAPLPTAPAPVAFNRQAVSGVLRPAILTYLTTQNNGLPAGNRAPQAQLDARTDRITDIATDVIRRNPALVNNSQQLSTAIAQGIMADAGLAGELRTVARARPGFEGSMAQSMGDGPLNNIITARITSDIQQTLAANQLSTRLSGAVNGASPPVAPTIAANQPPPGTELGSLTPTLPRTLVASVTPPGGSRSI